jgi:hypothetical protein
MMHAMCALFLLRPNRQRVPKMHDITAMQREAMMALKDGPISVEIFNLAHSGPQILALVPMLIEFGEKGPSDEAMASLTQKGHSALASSGQGRATAAGLAGQMIDFLGDQSASAADRQSRKDRLLNGPFNFVNVRHDGN